MWALLLQTNLRPRLSKLSPYWPPPLSRRRVNVRGSKEQSCPRRSSVELAPPSPDPSLAGEAAATPALRCHARVNSLSSRRTLPPSPPLAACMRLSRPHVKLLNKACTFSLLTS